MAQSRNITHRKHRSRDFGGVVLARVPCISNASTSDMAAKNGIMALKLYQSLDHADSTIEPGAGAAEISSELPQSRSWIVSPSFLVRAVKLEGRRAVRVVPRYLKRPTIRIIDHLNPQTYPTIFYRKLPLCKTC